MLFLTTDVFLAFLTESDAPRAEKAAEIFMALEDGKQKITTSPIVLWELATALHNAHGFDQPKSRVAGALSRLLSLRGFHVDDKQLWLDTLKLWRDQPLDFTEAYNLTFARQHR